MDANLRSMNAFGSVFIAARERKGLSVNDVCNAIHLSAKQIQALEHDDFSQLPEPVITRGFIRNYANYLNVDAEPLLKHYRSLVPQEDRSIVVKANVNTVMSQHAHQPWLLYVLGSILVLLFLTAWFYYMDSVNVAEPSAQETPVVTESTDALQPNAADVPVSTVTNDPETALPPTSTEAVVEPSANPTIEGSASTQLPIASAPPALPPTQPLVAKKLEMQFSEASWVRVKDKNGQVILEKTTTAGAVESLDGDLPFNIIIGNAKAAKVKFYGQEVDLTSATAKNVVRLKLE